MVIFRFLGSWLLAMGALALINDIARAMAPGMKLAFLSMRGLWQMFHEASLTSLQNLLQKSLHPLMWDPIMLALLKLPAWVARHGGGRGAVSVLNTFRAFRIILTNAVKYIGNVDAYDRRIQSAINIQGKKMQRRAQFLLTRALRRAGWK